jgi:hypothetical protein
MFVRAIKSQRHEMSALALPFFINPPPPHTHKPLFKGLWFRKFDSEVYSTGGTDAAVDIRLFRIKGPVSRDGGREKTLSVFE